MTRTQAIIGRIERKWKSSPQPPVTIDRRLILDELNQVYVDICQKGQILRSEILLTLENGVTRYDLSGTIYKIVAVKTPSTWLYPFEPATDQDDFSRYENNTALTGNPQKFLVWNKYLKLTPAPTVTGEQVSIYAIMNPANVLTMLTEPEIGGEWDRSLELGVLAQLARGEWIGLFDAEFRETLAHALNETALPQHVGHWSDILGF